MDLLWAKTIAYDNMWEPELNGLFIQENQADYFYFKVRNDICFCSSALQGEDVVQISVSLPRLSLPHQWTSASCGRDLFLMIDQKRALYLKKGSVIDMPSELRERYLEQFVRSYVEETFDLKEYTISQRGNFGYICYKNGEKIWSFTGKAYLYTDIVRWKDRVFFGTAGRGGNFYILNIDSGAVIASFKTGGTRYFVQGEGCVYLLQNSTHHGDSELICVNLLDGSILEKILINGIATENSRLQVVSQKIHAVTFEYSGNRLTKAVWNCIAM